MEDQNPYQELKRIEEQIGAVSDFDALRPIFYRLNALMEAHPGDFDIQFTGNELKQRIMARGTALRQQAEAEGIPIAPPAPLPGSPSVAPSGIVVPPEPLASPEPSGPVQSPPAPPPARRSSAPPPSRPRRSLVVPLAVLGLLVVLAGAALLILRSRSASRAAAEVSIATLPSGAHVSVTGKSAQGIRKDAACTSDCRLSLVPGTYQISAALDGYEPAPASLAVRAGQKTALRLSLQPQHQSLRLLTDLENGKVAIDDQPPADLTEGQAVFENLSPGSHTVKVTGPKGSASFQFEVAPATLPAITHPVEAHNVMAVLVASAGNHARLTTSGGPWKLAINGQPQPDATPAGTDLTDFHPGVNDIVLREGPDARNMSENFSPGPTLTAFLKTDVNTGTLIVSTGQDGVRVFLNGKEYPRRTKRGELRVQTLGKVAVRVAKAGFQDAPPQTVEVKKGADVRVQFALAPQPQFGSLQIHGGIAGTEVLVDQKDAGAVGSDGSFTLSTVPPGDHTVELRRDQYVSKRLPVSVKAGQSVVLGSAEAALAPARATIRLTRTPSNAVVTYRRGDETEAHEIPGAQIELPVGTYTIRATAPGFHEESAPVRLSAGEVRDLNVVLARERPKAPATVARGMDGFEEPGSWKQDGDQWIHKGGGFVGYAASPNGTFTFTVTLLHGGQIRWCVQYLDSRNYLLYELDRKNFWAGVVEKGKRYERVKEAHNLGNQKSFTVQVEIYPDRAIQKVRAGDEWKVLDTFVEPGRAFTNGKFGFLLPGGDEIAVSDFKFVPR